MRKSTVKYFQVLGALLLSASPVVAQYNAENNCVKNKESEMQGYERKYQTFYQFSLMPENIVELARQLEEAGQFSKDLSQREKNGITYKFMTDQISQMKRQLEMYKTLPDCSELQGSMGQ